LNIVEILHIHVWRWKKWDLLKLFQEWWRRDKGEWWRRWYIVNTFINVAMYPQYNNILKNKVNTLLPYSLWKCFIYQ
jgi:hypothetical protein